MKQSNNTDKLLKELIADSDQYKNDFIPEEEFPQIEAEKKNLIRSLMNIRMPKELPDELVALRMIICKRNWKKKEL